MNKRNDEIVKVICPVCEGKGFIEECKCDICEDDCIITCHNCNGKGIIIIDRRFEKNNID